MTNALHCSGHQFIRERFVESEGLSRGGYGETTRGSEEAEWPAGVFSHIDILHHIGLALCRERLGVDIFNGCYVNNPLFTYFLNYLDTLAQNIDIPIYPERA